MSHPARAHYTPLGYQRQQTAFGYDANGNLTTAPLANGVFELPTFDAANQLTSIGSRW